MKCEGDKDHGSSSCCDKCDDEAEWHDPIEFNQALQTDKTTIKVENMSDRPIQVGSHYCFTHVNPGLKVTKIEDPPRDLAPAGADYEELKTCPEAELRRLNIAAGTSVRFEPGDVCCVELVKLEAESPIVKGLRTRGVKP
nr:urease subunit beta [Streptomyces sp. CT34]